MSADPTFLLKVANVLEEAAKVIDSHEAEKNAAVKIAREAALKNISDRYTEATGEEIPPEVFDKISSSGEDVLSTVKHLLEKTAGSTGVESLGRSGEKSAQKQPTTKKEAAAAAYDRFGEFIIS
jgi:hypothetical protein